MRRQLQVAIITLAASSAVAVAASAQDSVRVHSREPRTFVYSIGPDNFQFDMRRGRLGITVDLRPDASRDSVGARVAGLTPGGPAERAGVQAGDLITRFNGTRLAVTDGSSSGDDDRSRPGMRLINLASRLDQGDTVRLDLRRESRTLTVTFQAAETDMDQLVERMRIPGNGQMMMRSFGPEGPFGGEMPGGGQVRVFVDGNAASDLELVKVSPQLAEGLGISEGLLVVDVGSDTALGLRAGDVIVAIGGRRPTSPPHAMRILSTYDAGEAVQFDVMRQRRRVTVNGKVPERGHGTWRVRPNNFEFMMPKMPLWEGEGGAMQWQQMPRMMMPSPDIRLRVPGDQLPKTLLRIEGRV